MGSFIRTEQKRIAVKTHKHLSVNLINLYCNFWKMKDKFYI